MKLVLRVFLLLFALLGAFSFTGFSSGSDALELVIDGNLFESDVPPVLKKDTVLVPLKVVITALGKDISFDEVTKEILVTGRDQQIKLKAGSSLAWVNGREVQVPLPVEIISGRTMVPLRFLAENMEMEVSWDGSNKRVVVNTGSEGRQVPFEWYTIDEQKGWVFTSKSREYIGRWHRETYLPYMDFDVATSPDQTFHKEPLRTFAPEWVPANDYSSYLVLWAYLGEAMSGGYGILIQEVQITGNEVLVKVLPFSPEPGAFAHMEVNYPDDMVRVAWSDLGDAVDLQVVFVDQNGDVLERVLVNKP